MGNATQVLMDVTMGFIGILFLLAVFARDDVSAQAKQAQPAASTEESITTTLKEQQQTAAQPQSAFAQPTLTIDGVGRDVRTFYLDDAQVTREELTKLVRQRGLKKLRIRSNPDLAVQAAMDIKLLCVEGGVKTFEDVRFRNSSLNTRGP